MATDDRPGPIEIAPEVFRLWAPFGPANGIPNAVYLLRGPMPTLVDAGVDRAPTAQLMDPLRAMGLGLDDVRTLLLTHGHPDHMGGAADLRRASPGVRILCHPADRGWVEDHRAGFDESVGSLGDDWRPDAATEAEQLAQAGPSVSVDGVLEAGAKVEVGSDQVVEVAHVPGHTAGSIAYLHGPTGVLFTGDALQGRGLELPGVPAGFPGYADVNAYRSSLALVDRLAPFVMATSHHGVLDRVAWREHVARSVAFVEEMDTLVMAVLQDAARPVRLREVAAVVAGQFPDYEHAWQLHWTTRAHLCGLVADGRANEHQPGEFSAV